MCSDYQTALMAGWKPHPDIGVTRNIVVSYIYSDETYAIIKRETNELIGTISLYDNNSRKDVLSRELGFCLNKKFRSHGYMTEACMAIIDFAFNVLKLDILTVCHMPQNKKSEAVINKVGFNYEGCLRMYRRLFDGSIVDCVFYSITRQEFKECYL